MFSVNVLLRLQPCAVPQLLRNVHVTTARHGASLTRAVSARQHRGVTRSILQVKTLCLSPRCVSTNVSTPEDGTLVYSGSLARAVLGVKFFSYSSSGMSLLLMPQIIFNSGVGVNSFALQVAFCSVIGFFTFLTPALLHYVTKGYVVRLYHNADRDTYTAVTYSVFLMEKKNVFHQREVRIPAMSRMFTSFYANKMGLLVNPERFTPQDYNHLMGYDKPFSFDTDSMDGPNKS